ncbi:uncharacterized protein LOC117785261 isoform X2 [Drosophila innubila]|uniref:uncharacterized protein LOC117785261 isoform X2 n=1 Tax=Drosophila innubila TaxID=198719 RepID=UPI00148C3EBB|nr:uncharacterized protein LOC117785261 isoform X2 [Drosophila innubila]
MSRRNFKTKTYPKKNYTKNQHKFKGTKNMSEYAATGQETERKTAGIPARYQPEERGIPSRNCQPEERTTPSRNYAYQERGTPSRYCQSPEQGISPRFYQPEDEGNISRNYQPEQVGSSSRNYQAQEREIPSIFNQSQAEGMPSRFRYQPEEQGTPSRNYQSQERGTLSRYCQPENIPAGEASLMPEQFQRSPDNRRGSGYDLNLERDPAGFQKRYNPSSERQLYTSREFSPERNYSRSPARDLGCMSPVGAEEKVIRPDKRMLKGETTQGSARKRRREKLPGLGEPGGRDDPNRKYLCGSRTKWYLRYLKAGYPPDEAIKMAKEAKQPATQFKLNSINPDVEKQEEPVIQANEPARSNERCQDPLKLFLLPLGYPKITLTYQQNLNLEEAITMEVASSRLGVPLRFTSIAFKKGFLEVECYNKISADWLMETVSKLTAYQGPRVEAKYQIPTEEQFLIKAFLPRSAEKSDADILQLLKSQNSYDIDLWTLVYRQKRDDGVFVHLKIDKKSAYNIAEKNDHTLFYRLGKIPVRGLNKIDFTSEEFEEYAGAVD